MPRSILVLLSFGILLTTFRSRPEFLQWERGKWVAGFPHDARSADPVLESDLDADGSIERIVLRGAQITVMRDALRVWTTPPQWNVFMAQMADLNWDGRPEIVMAVWRPFKPWPIDAWLPHGGRIAGFHDAQNRSCHIILWGWGGTRFRELWAGSAMAEPVIGFFAADWNADGRDEFMTVESSYDSPARGRAVSLWEWNGFGFSLVDRWNTILRRFVVLKEENGSPAVLLESGNGGF